MILFKIQAEKQIKLPKGSVSALKSNKKVQMTIKCKSVKNAIGYRIQYSTDYRFMLCMTWWIQKRNTKEDILFQSRVKRMDKKL